MLDIKMPGMDGYEVAKEIANLKVSATMIAITGFGQEEDRAKSKAAGFDYHFTKPVNISEIEKIINLTP